MSEHPRPDAAAELLRRTTSARGRSFSLSSTQLRYLLRLSSNDADLADGCSADVSKFRDELPTSCRAGDQPDQIVEVRSCRC